MIIDAHTHIGNDKDGSQMSAKTLSFALRSLGIDRAVVFPMDEIDAGSCFREANDKLSREISMFQDRFIGFCRIDPKHVNAISELQRCVKFLNLRGVKLHPRMQKFRVDSNEVLYLILNARLLSVPVIFHTEVNYGVNGEQRYMPEDFESLLYSVEESVPGAKIILGHSFSQGMGTEKAIDLALKFSDIVYLELSINRIEFVKNIVEHVPPSNILFGTDLPYGVAKNILTTKKFIQETDLLSEEDKKMILGENIANLTTREGYTKQMIAKTRKEIKGLENNYVGAVAVINSVDKDPAHLIKRKWTSLIYNVLGKVEPLINPIDKENHNFSKDVYLYATDKNFDLPVSIIAKEKEKKLYVFVPSIRIKEDTIRSSKIIEEDDVVLVKDCALSYKPTNKTESLDEIFVKIAQRIASTLNKDYTVKRVVYEN